MLIGLNYVACNKHCHWLTNSSGNMTTSRQYF